MRLHTYMYERLVPALYPLVCMLFLNPLVPSASIKGTLANSADPDQTPQNAASDQGLHRLH